MQKKLVAARNLPAGQVLTENDIAIKAPNDGVPVSELDNVLGMRLTVDLAADDNILYEALEKVAVSLKRAAGRAY
jgi:N-acetylneuraminate synthase/sialic acid synthase